MECVTSISNKQRIRRRTVLRRRSPSSPFAYQEADLNTIALKAQRCIVACGSRMPMARLAALALLSLVVIPARLNASGLTLTTVHTFTGGSTDASAPDGPVILASDGNYYGTASAGGASSDGVVFKLTSTGTFSIVHSFAGSDGMTPKAGVIEGSDGDLYGTTS